MISYDQNNLTQLSDAGRAPCGGEGGVWRCADAIEEGAE